MINGQISVIIISMLICPLPASVVGYRFISFYKDLSALWLGIAIITVSLWVFLQGLIYFVTDPTFQFLILQIARTLGITCAICVLFFTLEYSTGKAITLPLGLLFIVPALLLQIVLFGFPDQFMMVEVVGSEVEYTFNTFGYMHIAMVVLLYVFSIAILFREVVVSSGRLQKQSITLLAGLLGGIVLSFVPLIGIDFAYLDPMALGTFTSVGIFSFGLYRYDLFTTNPISLDMAFRSSYDSIVVINKNNEIIKVNEKFLDEFNLTRSILGESASTVLHPEIAEMYNSDTITKSVYLNDSDSHYHISKTQIEYGRGMTGVILTIKDITEIKETEQNLSLLKQILSRVLQHNLRNRLTVVSGIANKLRKKSTNPQKTKQLQQIEASSDELVTLSEKAQTLSKIIDTQSEFTTITADHFITAAITECSESIDASSVELTQSIDDSETNLLVHPDATKILTNAIENAIEHNPNEIKQVSIVSGHNTQSNEYYIEIEDNGPGLPKEEIDVIESGTESNLAHGSGIGLWIMKVLTEKSEGSIDIVRSKTGTSIKFTFKVADTEEVYAS